MSGLGPSVQNVIDEDMPEIIGELVTFNMFDKTPIAFLSREMLDLFKAYCEQEQDIVNPTDDDARATHKAYTILAGSSEAAEDRVMSWGQCKLTYSKLKY